MRGVRALGARGGIYTRRVRSLGAGAWDERMGGSRMVVVRWHCDISPEPSISDQFRLLLGTTLCLCATAFGISCVHVCLVQFASRLGAQRVLEHQPPTRST